jgi:hypothetical protein
VIIKGYIQNYDGQCLTIAAPFSDDCLLGKQQITECEIRLDDGRTISADQRKKIYATFRDISLYSGHLPDEVKAIMKYEFISRTGAGYFSLSNVDMTAARDFLQFLIEFCIENDIPTSDNPINRAPDIARYIYCCLINKKCCICGNKTQLHHVDRVGMGRDRREITHIGMRAEPLCAKCHMEAHSMAQEEFDGKYKIFGIKIDAEIAKVYKLKGGFYG